MVEATYTTHVLYQFKSISSQQLGFPQYLIVFNSMLIVPGELQKGWEVGAGGGPEAV